MTRLLLSLFGSLCTFGWTHLVDIHISTPSEEHMIEVEKQEKEIIEDVNSLNDPASTEDEKLERELNLLKNERYG
ncbi:MAG: hypothetical protein ACLFUW_00360 [Bacteroidales bacterium]